MPLPACSRCFPHQGTWRASQLFARPHPSGGRASTSLLDGGVVAGCSLHCLPRNFDGNEHALLLKPLCREAVLVIRPFALWHNTPWRRLQRNRPVSKFVEGEYAAPFRRMPERSDSIRQDWQDSAFSGIHRWFGAQQVLSPGRFREIDVGNLVQDRFGPDECEMIIDPFAAGDVAFPQA